MGIGLAMAMSGFDANLGIDSEIGVKTEILVGLIIAPQADTLCLKAVDLRLELFYGVL